MRETATLFFCREQTFDQAQALWAIPWQGIFFVNEADFFDFLFDYTFSEMTDLPAIWYTIYVIPRLSALLNRKEIGMATKCNDSKRRDHKGRILKTGESQRADLIYQCRFTDIRGKRHCIYNADLKALWEEEKRIQVQINMGIDYAGGNITVIELCKRYTDLRRIGVKRNTQLNFDKTLRHLERSDIGHKMIRDLKMTEVKQ